jgi:hypothetical protein
MDKWNIGMMGLKDGALYLSFKSNYEGCRL